MQELRVFVFFSHGQKILLRHFSQNVRKYRLKNIVMVSSNTTVRQITKNVSAKKTDVDGHDQGLQLTPKIASEFIIKKLCLQAILPHCSGFQPKEEK